MFSVLTFFLKASVVGCLSVFLGAVATKSLKNPMFFYHWNHQIIMQMNPFTMK
jgi:hypothetical protein